MIAPLVDWGDIFSFQDYGALVALLANSIIAGAVLGVVGGLIGVFVMQRDLAFAVHGVSELSFAGAAAALLFGGSVVAGSLGGALVAAILIGILGSRARDRNSIVGVLMPFGLGLGILFLSLYDGRSANSFSLLTGQIVSVSSPDLGWLIGISVVVLIGLLLMWNPLRFDSLDAVAASARGIPTRFVSLAFMVLLGLIVAVSVHIIGALLVMALLVTPAAAAMRLTRGPARGAAAGRTVRIRLSGRRDPARARRHPAGEPVHHDDLVPHLRRMLGYAAPAGAGAARRARMTVTPRLPGPTHRLRPRI